ncbi:ATPase [Diatrype stigma]|uniref:ATPase n=1 Tax=Diatrype stigma TaxID=117547 RepID=A0AAN9UL10_9PEZI
MRPRYLHGPYMRLHSTRTRTWANPRRRLCTDCLQARDRLRNANATITLNLSRRPTRRIPLAAAEPVGLRRSSLVPEWLPRARSYASIAATATAPETEEREVEDLDPDDIGPIQEYDRRVSEGRLRNDEHQRGIIQSLQHLHDELAHYQARPVVHPTFESLKPQKKSIFAGWFGSASGASRRKAIPDDLPRGLYLYGDVGSGKTMLMDLFYDTLPSAVRSKLRIHFHSFMQDIHKRLHRMKMEHGNDIDAIPFVAADIAESANVLCFDEFQCTDVADAMILRRLLESLMSHGVVLVTTSNRHPDELYKNGIQRDSFIPAINLLKSRLHVINLDSPTDYRKIPRPPSGVYHTPLDSHAPSHVEKWLRFLGDPESPEPPHPEVVKVWGRELRVPRVSGRCAWFTFQELIGQATGAADYLELMRCYDAFIVSDVPGMTFRERDLARRFITFIDAVYESHAKLVLTTAVPLTQLFVSPEELRASVREGELGKGKGQREVDSLDLGAPGHGESEGHAMQHMLEDVDSNIDQLKTSSLFSGEEERFAFARALSRLSHMASREWVERGMGLELSGGKKERDDWAKTRSRQFEDSM